MKAIKNLDKELPLCCAKCGGTRFEVVEDGLQCFFDGWIHYFSDDQIAAFRKRALDKTNPVCKDRG